jgi:hypothetical protein
VLRGEDGGRGGVTGSVRSGTTIWRRIRQRRVSYIGWLRDGEEVFSSISIFLRKLKATERKGPKQSIMPEAFCDPLGCVGSKKSVLTFGTRVLARLDFTQEKKATACHSSGGLSTM